VKEIRPVLKIPEKYSRISEIILIKEINMSKNISE
jgi:hypothetical protein